MTVYYLSFKQGQVGGHANSANVVSGTSVPSADFYFVVGGNLLAPQLSKSSAVQALHAIEAFVRGDATIPFGLPAGGV